jgi:hypothetical protein
VIVRCPNCSCEFDAPTPIENELDAVASDIITQDQYRLVVLARTIVKKLLQEYS